MTGAMIDLVAGVCADFMGYGAHEVGSMGGGYCHENPGRATELWVAGVPLTVTSPGGLICALARIAVGTADSLDGEFLRRFLT